MAGINISWDFKIVEYNTCIAKTLDIINRREYLIGTQCPTILLIKMKVRKHPDMTNP